MINPETIKKKAADLLPEIIAIRRYLHAHPELSFQEYATAAYVEEILKRAKIPYRSGVGGTGIIASVEGKNPGVRTIAFRADLDALPIQEKNKCDYKSVNDGVMHACGHDVHTACLLGAALIVQELKDELTGTIRFIFQPGEEKLPGGATHMIAAGALKNPEPEFIVAQHVFPELEAGKVGFRKGMYMASTDELYLRVTGKGGHAAMPSQYINPLLIASRILVRLQEEFMDETTRKIPDHIPTVLAFGKITGTGATNVIPDQVFLEGTFRTMNEKWRHEAHQRMRDICTQLAKESGAEAELTIEKGYPFLINDEAITGNMMEAAAEYLGKDKIVELDLRMTAEDFAWYSQVIPACFYRLGTRNEAKGIVSPVHTATFDVDETALETGMGLMAYAALR